MGFRISSITQNAGICRVESRAGPVEARWLAIEALKGASSSFLQMNTADGFGAYFLEKLIPSKLRSSSSRISHSTKKPWFLSPRHKVLVFDGVVQLTKKDECA
ncbi:hypothetical protein S83_018646 [Arachis hypogaea]